MMLERNKEWFEKLIDKLEPEPELCEIEAGSLRDLGNEVNQVEDTV